MKKRGLAATCPAVRKRVAQMGGRAAWATGRRFGFTSETAKLAIKKRWDNKKYVLSKEQVDDSKEAGV